jgi:hypothetical protein
MDDQAGLFDRPEQELPATPSRSTWGRARERFARAVVVDLVVRDAAALRAEALRALGRAVPVSAAEGDAAADLLDPEEEILTSSAAALQWCLEPTNGMCPLLESDAVRIDGIDLATEERSATLVRASWTVTVKIATRPRRAGSRSDCAQPPRRRPAPRSSGASRPLGTGPRSRARRWSESPA